MKEDKTTSRLNSARIELPLGPKINLIEFNDKFVNKIRLFKDLETGMLMNKYMTVNLDIFENLEKF